MTDEFEPNQIFMTNIFMVSPFVVALSRRRNTSAQKKYRHCFASKIAKQLHQTNSNALFRFVFFQFRTTRTSNNNRILDQLYGTFSQIHSRTKTNTHLVDSLFEYRQCLFHCMKKLTTLYNVRNSLGFFVGYFFVSLYTEIQLLFFIRNTFYLKLFEKLEKSSLSNRRPKCFTSIVG